MTNPFSVQRTLGGADTTRLVLEGYLDAFTAPLFERALQEEVDEGRLRLVVDGSRLSYISSAGLGVFMTFVGEVRDRGGDLKICGLSPRLREVFDLLGFATIFDLVEDADAAEGLFAAGSLRTG